MNLEPLKNWAIPSTESLVISGPCSAETEAQVLTTARQLKNIGINIYRAGIWKPRTRPNSFEGVGSIGLSWLKTVKKETGMLTTVEVANAKHIYEALKAEVDILWVGARTSVNPFAMQEIAEALKGVDIPVMVKNPINPDLELWIGAMERINQAGITKIAAIHRGFSSYEKTKFRNKPQWQIPIELKRRFPNLPIICDPSHIAGNRKLITEISQKAMDLDMNGLMIESHHMPDKAWSDSKQQITPTNLSLLLNKLIKRSVEPNHVSTKDLDQLREEIDQYDQEVLSILSARMKCASAIGRYKKRNKMTILQASRWNAILNSRVTEGNHLGLSNEIITSIFKAIHQESINKQEAILLGRSGEAKRKYNC